MPNPQSSDRISRKFPNENTNSIDDIDFTYYEIEHLKVLNKIAAILNKLASK